jgi:hypothetical protein
MIAPAKNTRSKFWVSFRFIFFGVGGFWLMITAWAYLFVSPLVLASQIIWWCFLATLSFAGAVSMLFGVGEWSRKKYLIVFFSIPLSMLLWFLPFYPQGKLDGALAPAAAAIISYLMVKRHYSRRCSEPDSCVNSAKADA